MDINFFKKIAHHRKGDINFDKKLQIIKRFKYVFCFIVKKKCFLFLSNFGFFFFFDPNN
jgi:hypothetical protein